MRNLNAIEKYLKDYNFNNARRTLLESRLRFENCNTAACFEMTKELELLRYITGVVEDGLDVLDLLDEKYKAILEQHYLERIRMEEIADCMHISRSRCYDLCREAVVWLDKVVNGAEMNLDN